MIKPNNHSKALQSSLLYKIKFKQNKKQNKNLLFLQPIRVRQILDCKFQDYALHAFPEKHKIECSLFYTTSADLAEDTLKVQTSSTFAFCVVMIMYWMDGFLFSVFYQQKGSKNPTQVHAR